MAEQNDEKPPFGKSWTTLYAAVLIALLVEIALFTLFTEFFK